ncbi:DUF4907 domain-containing protein [Taibaiella soli]|uniref:DUF4907 domain-containing protein n=1 Tax=Taibaiella soli TaxID=1649169 RepID=UPI001402B36D|nr:DUF4907 domain-containing protein [Taibaiella soli]
MRENAIDLRTQSFNKTPVNFLSSPKVLLFCSCFCAAHLAAAQSNKASFPDGSQNVHASFASKIIPVNNTYGYEIYREGKLFIQQRNIPGRPGNGGFADSTSAKQVAELVIKKLKNGEMPPTVSAEELKSLHIQ